MAAARQQREDHSGGHSGGGNGSGGGSRSARRRRAEPRRSVRPGFSHEKALIFGVIQVLAGIAALVLGVVSISTRAWGYYYASGFWSGTFFFVSGVFGLASARRKSNCTIVTFMVFSAMSAILALVTLTLSSIGVATENMLFQQHRHQEVHELGQGNALAVHSLIIVVSVIAAICGTASSIVGCRAVCGVWYLPDNPYHSAGDLQTPTSAEFSTGYRQNSNLQYLIDPDLRTQAQHLFAASSGTSGATNGAAPGTSICPPASYEYPPATLPPPSGPQQIAILAPAADGSVYGMVQATSDQAGGISQVMYIMPNNGPCPQPGAVPESTMPEPPSTPPPCYSQINLTQVGLDDSNSGMAHSHSATTGFNGNMPELPGYTSVAMDGTSNAQPQETTFPTQLPPLDRLIPLTGTRVVAQRTHRNSGQHRPVSLTASRTSGTQTCSAVDPSVGVTSGGTSQHSQSQRTHRAPVTSQRHSTSSGSTSSNTDSHHREAAGHRRAPSSECRGANGGMCDSSGHGTCHRHGQSVGMQAGAQSRSGSSNVRTAPSRHHTSSSGSSSSRNMSSSQSASGGNSSRGSRGGRDRHSKGPSETLIGGNSGSRDASASDTQADHSGGVILRGANHPHRTSQGHWRLSGSFMPPPQPVLGTAMTSHPQELVVSSFPSEGASADSASGGHRRWIPSTVLPPQYISSEQQHQSSNLSPLNSVL